MSFSVVTIHKFSNEVQIFSYRLDLRSAKQNGAFQSRSFSQWGVLLAWLLDFLSEAMRKWEAVATHVVVTVAELKGKSGCHHPYNIMAGTKNQVPLKIQPQEWSGRHFIIKLL